MIVEPAPATSRVVQCQEAFTRYVLPEIGVLLRVAGTLTRGAADAEGLVQDTLLRAYRGIDQFDGAHPRAWLLTIMRDTQINRTRRRGPEFLDGQDSAFDHSVSEHDETPRALVVGAAFDSVVSEALVALPERFNEVVIMVDVNGLSYAEAAEVLRVPVGTIMSRLHRARTRVRQRLVAAGLAPRRRL